MLLCSINVFSVAGQKPSAAGRGRAAYAGDFAVPSAMASSSKTHALPESAAATRNRLAAACAHLYTPLSLQHFRKVFNTVCMQSLRMAAFSWQALSKLGSHYNPAYKLSLHNAIAHIPLILSLQCISTSHTQDHGQSQAMRTQSVLPHVPFAS
jgi:glutamate-1-semialdehyde aminotransferase